MWLIVTTREYRQWALTLQDRDRARLHRAEHRLMETGPHLGRPIADRVEGSRYYNMKELRPTPTLRAFYALDPQRRVVMLCGGDKASSRRGGAWYRKMIRRADRLYDIHLTNLRHSPQS